MSGSIAAVAPAEPKGSDCGAQGQRLRSPRVATAEPKGSDCGAQGSAIGAEKNKVASSRDCTRVQRFLRISTTLTTLPLGTLCSPRFLRRGPAKCYGGNGFWHLFRSRGQGPGRRLSREAACGGSPLSHRRNASANWSRQTTPRVRTRRRPLERALGLVATAEPKGGDCGAQGQRLRSPRVATAEPKGSDCGAPKLICNRRSSHACNLFKDACRREVHACHSGVRGPIFSGPSSADMPSS